MELTDRDTLLRMLTEAEIALHKLMIGQSIVSLSRADSAGNNRSYQYSQANIAQLKTYISS